MAGHSQFKNIMHRKGAQDARRARLFTKLIREVAVAAKTGLPDPAANPRLRAAIAAARQANLPRDRIDKAIGKATGEGGEADYVEMRYEGYGPGGVAIIVEALTDNRNRTAADLRASFSRHGGSLAETNAVAFMFNRVGQITFPAAAASAEAMFEAAVGAGAENVESDAEGHTVTTSVDDFAAVREALEAAFGEPEGAFLAWQPVSTVPIDEETAASVLRLLEALDDNDDVQRVSANFEVSGDVLRRLTT